MEFFKKITTKLIGNKYIITAEVRQIQLDGLMCESFEALRNEIVNKLTNDLYKDIKKEVFKSDAFKEEILNRVIRKLIKEEIWQQQNQQ